MVARRKWVLAAIAVVVVGVIVWCTFRQREPEYAGRKLSEWVLALDETSPTDVREDARDAIRFLGTNAVPYLARWITYEIPDWKWKPYRRVGPVLGGFISRGEKQRRSRLAWEALATDGLDASGAIGELVHVANDTNRLRRRLDAINVLGRLGKAGLPALVGVLTNEQARPSKFPSVCDASAAWIWRLGDLDPNTARLAVPALMSMLQDTDAFAREIATKALRAIDPKALDKGSKP